MSTRAYVKSDWTTARVVRDRDGRLWGRDATTFDSFARRWVRVGSDRESDGCYEESMARRYGPLVPVLDADGLPVVRTVGDLTARHLGGCVSVEGGQPALLIAMRKPLPGELRVALFVSTYGADPASTDYLPLDTPCEVIG